MLIEGILCCSSGQYLQTVVCRIKQQPKYNVCEKKFDTGLRILRFPHLNFLFKYIQHGGVVLYSVQWRGCSAPHVLYSVCWVETKISHKRESGDQKHFWCWHLTDCSHINGWRHGWCGETRYQRSGSSSSNTRPHAVIHCVWVRRGFPSVRLRLCVCHFTGGGSQT